MHPWLIYPVTFALLLVPFEIGFRFSREPSHKLSSEQRSQVGTVLAALLAVLGFILAFSFSIVESRFTARKQMVVTEANAIGTTWLRTQFLPDEAAVRSRELLRLYVDERLAVTLESVPQLVKSSAQIQNELWRLATAAALEEPRSVPLGLYVSSLNDVIDLHEERLTITLRHHLPTVFLVTLYVIALLAMGLLGYSMGQTRSRSVVATLSLLLVLSALLQIVVDIDRPQQRGFRIGQGPMEDVQRSMRNEPARVR